MSGRIRPGNPGTQGQVQRVSFTATASTTALAGRTLVNGQSLPHVYVDVRVLGGQAHVAFGGSNVDAATNDDWPIVAEDAWVTFKLLAADTHVSVKGNSTTGDLVIWYSGEGTA